MDLMITTSMQDSLERIEVIYMEELRDLLENIQDTYEDFVGFIMSVAEKSEYRKKKLISYIKNNPEVNTSDVIHYTSVELGLYADYKKTESEMLV